MKKRGFTLVEVMMSLFILTVIGMSVVASTIMARKMSEEAVFQGTASSAALSYLEQIRGMDYQSLLNAIGSPTTVPLPCQLDEVTNDPLYLNVANTKTVVIDADTSGVPNKWMKMSLTPVLTNLEPSQGWRAIDIQIEYSWVGPDARMSHKRALRAIRSFVPTF